MNEKVAFMDQLLVDAYISALAGLKEKTIMLQNNMNIVLNELSNEVQNCKTNGTGQDNELRTRINLFYAMLEDMENQMKEGFSVGDIKSISNTKDNLDAVDKEMQHINDILGLDTVDDIENEQEETRISSNVTNVEENKVEEQKVEQMGTNSASYEDSNGQLVIDDVSLIKDYSYLTKEAQDITELAKIPLDVLKNYTIVSYTYDGKTRQVINWFDLLLKLCRKFTCDYGAEFTRIMQTWATKKQMKRVFRSAAEGIDTTRYTELNKKWQIYSKLGAGDTCRVLAQIKNDLGIEEIQCELNKRKKVKIEETKTDTKIENKTVNEKQVNIKIEDIKVGNQNEKDIFANCSSVLLSQGFSKNKKVKGFTFDSTNYKVSGYIEMLNKICNILINRNEDKFKQLITNEEYHGTLKRYFITEREYLDIPKNQREYNRIGETSYYVYKFIPNIQIEKRIKLLLANYGIGHVLFIVYYSE